MTFANLKKPFPTINRISWNSVNTITAVGFAWKKTNTKSNLLYHCSIFKKKDFYQMLILKRSENIS
jgi:hypothetical protein